MHCPPLVTPHIGKALLPTIFHTIYVNDMHISFNCVTCPFVNQVQLGINKIAGRVDQNGLNLSWKNVLVFSKSHGVWPLPYIKSNDVSSPLEKEHKFFRVVLDKKLTFIPHIKQLKQKCLRT